MLILFVGDLHGSLTAACQAVDRAVECDVDVIMQAGDFGIWTHTTYGVQYLIELQRYLDKHGQVLYFVDGNHENFDHLEAIPLTPSGLRMVNDNIIHVPRGKVLEWDGTKIMGFGGANSIDGPDSPKWWGGQSRGPASIEQFYSSDEIARRNLPAHIDLGNWWPQEDITQEQVDAVEEQKVDILLTHEAPKDVQVPGIYKDYHAGRRQRYLIQQVMEKVQPKLMVHGHYHRRYTSRIGDTKVVGLADHNGSVNNMTYLVDTEEL